MEQYKGGNIKNYLYNWENITSDPYILQIIKYGLKLEFESMPLKQRHQIHLSFSEMNIIDTEIENLLKKEE